MKKQLKNMKGITLVALIITIIVLLILAVVAITSISKSNIINNTKNAGAAYTEAEEKEKVTLAVHEAMLEGKGNIYKNGVENGMNAQFSNNGWEEVSSDADTMTVKIKVSQRQYKITLKTGAIELVSENITDENNPDLSLLKQYILGTNGLGRTDIQKLLVLDKYSSDFINDESQIPDEYKEIKTNLGTLTISYYALVSSSSAYNDTTSKYDFNYTYDFYFEYKNKKYKFRVDAADEKLTNGKSSNLKELSYQNEKKYNEDINVGDTVWFDDKTWIIMYNDTTRGIQMISQDVLEEITLGTSDTTVETETIDGVTNENLLKAITSYNNAVDILNNKCKELVTTKEGMTVRCVGSNPINPNDKVTDKLSTGVINEEPSEYTYSNPGHLSNVGKVSDYEYEADYDRLVTMDAINNEGYYWLASRNVYEQSRLMSDSSISYLVEFCVRFVAKGQSYKTEKIWGVSKSGTMNDSVRYGLRPVITLGNTPLKKNTEETTKWIIE